MDTYKFITVKDWHIRYVAKHMREVDIVETRAMNYEPLEALRVSVGMSKHCKTVIYKGKPIAIFGIVAGSLVSCVGVPWFLGTDTLSRIGRSFVKYGRIAVEEMLNDFSMLENAVHDKNIKSIEFLKALGFTIGEKYEVTPGNWFHLFTKMRG